MRIPCIRPEVQYKRIHFAPRFTRVHKRIENDADFSLKKVVIEGASDAVMFLDEKLFRDEATDCAKRSRSSIALKNYFNRVFWPSFGDSTKFFILELGDF